MGKPTRTITPLLPARTGMIEGLAYTLWLPTPPQSPARAGIVIVHGAGSAKESHHDYARAAVALGLGAICFDQRGHGESEGPLDARMVDDVVTIAGVLREGLGDGDAPIALRGSSMGGYVAIISAQPVRAVAVVAICPASGVMLRRGVEAGRLGFAADPKSLDAFLGDHDLSRSVESLSSPLLLLHAEGDERVPVQQSRELAAQMTNPHSRLIVLPGGHHRSIQHDAELQAVSLRFIEQALGLRTRRARR